MDPADVELRTLLPASGASTVEGVLDGLGLPSAGERPHLLVNMIASADGKARFAGRTAALGNAADRSLFHGLRGRVDAVLVGAGTVRDERYGPLVRDPERRTQRVKRGLREQPLACVVSASLDLSPDLPLLADPESLVVVLTPAEGELAACAAEVHYVRETAAGRLDLAAALGELRERFGVRWAVCEGGPHLNSQLLADGVLDELFVSIAPRLAGGGDALTIVAGQAVEQLAELRLSWLLESEDYLFARYAVGTRG